jgi:hypothetical protein|tara:strand:+ start:438 stop:860 length:423 start_codon:yes stop_codon:yes gene_type:complete
MTDRGYQTIPALMLKDTGYAPLIHGENDVFSLDDAHALCDALEEVVTIWKEGMDAFGLETQEECAGTSYGAIMLMRLAFHDLKNAIPSTPREEADGFLRELADSFTPLSRSYARTPMLAQWYASLPKRVAEAYNRLRGPR